MNRCKLSSRQSRFISPFLPWHAKTGQTVWSWGWRGLRSEGAAVEYNFTNVYHRISPFTLLHYLGLRDEWAQKSEAFIHCKDSHARYSPWPWLCRTKDHKRPPAASYKLDHGYILSVLYQHQFSIDSSPRILYARTATSSQSQHGSRLWLNSSRSLPSHSSKPKFVPNFPQAAMELSSSSVQWNPKLSTVTTSTTFSSWQLDQSCRKSPAANNQILPENVTTPPSSVCGIPPRQLGSRYTLHSI